MLRALIITNCILIGLGDLTFALADLPPGRVEQAVQTQSAQTQAESHNPAQKDAAPFAEGSADSVGSSVPDPLTQIANWQDLTQQSTSQQSASQLGMSGAEAERYRSTTPFGEAQRFSTGLDLYSEPEFKGDLVIFGDNVALKVGGFAKADFIYDFDPIDSQDSFVTASIPVDAPPRTNFRAHARQSRLNLDARWPTQDRIVKIYMEGDFFGTGEQFRLRHAYGQIESLSKTRGSSLILPLVSRV
jgi:hypothetical protein